MKAKPCRILNLAEAGGKGCSTSQSLPGGSQAAALGRRCRTSHPVGSGAAAPSGARGAERRRPRVLAPQRRAAAPGTAEAANVELQESLVTS